MQEPTIVLIGAGKVATHLGRQLKLLGYSIASIWSRSSSSAKKLGQQLNCPWTNQFLELPAVDLYIIMVSDDAILSVAQALSTSRVAKNGLVVHTSGAVPSSILAPFFSNYGVFYPLQSFSIGVKPDFLTIPFCIFSKKTKHEELLVQLAKSISPIVHILTDEQRAHLHLSAVFVNNFTNYLQHIGTNILSKQKLPYSLLRPLLGETIRKLDRMPPHEAQTGPAIRGDQQTIQKHLKLLEGKREWQKIYQVLSEGIVTDMNDR